MRDGASKERLPRLGKGMRPCRTYKCHIRVLGPCVSWAARESMEGSGEGQVGLPGGCNSVQAGMPLQVFGQDTVPQALGGVWAHCEEMCVEDAEEEDPFGWGGSLDGLE
jgi:hypothetical protein